MRERDGTEPGATTSARPSLSAHAHDPLVRFQKPQMPSAEHVEAYFALSRERRWFSNDGPCALLLAERLSAYIGAGAEAIPVANATLGLMLALEAMAGERRDEGGYVLVPSFTYVASVNAIRWAGFEPLFGDVDTDAWHLDPPTIERAVDQHGERLVAVMPCSTFGTAPPPPTTRAWEDACRANGVPMVVDSAAGFGSTDAEGRKLGTHGDVEVFSFHATKPFAIGEGGAICATDPALVDRLRRLVAFGLDTSRHVTLAGGLNAKMSEIHAATALAVLDGYDDILAARRSRAQALRELLSHVDVRFQHQTAMSTWQAVPIVVGSPSAREAVAHEARRRGVQVRVYHEPLHCMPVFAEHPRVGPLDVTEALGSRIICLPMANDLDDADLDLIARAVEAGCRAAGAG